MLSLEDAWILAGDDRTFEEYCANAKDFTGIVCIRHPDRLSEGREGEGRPICKECYDTYWDWNQR